MDLKSFYGSSKYVREIPDGNDRDDPELSDDKDHNEDNNPPHHNYILAYGSDDPEPEDHNSHAIIPETDVESEDSEDNMTLQEIAPHT
nr:unnamed protein product [Callosobruchus analis]